MLLAASTKPTVNELKAEYVKYYADVPVQKYAAMYIGRDEDTIIRWRKEDQAFADAVQRARAEWVRKMLISTKAEFALERLERSMFSSLPESLNGSVYNTFIQTHSINPNDPDTRKLVDQTLAVMMEATRRVPSSQLVAAPDAVPNH